MLMLTNVVDGNSNTPLMIVANKARNDSIDLIQYLIDHKFIKYCLKTSLHNSRKYG